jgi:hypothetical protein
MTIPVWLAQGFKYDLFEFIFEILTYLLKFLFGKQFLKIFYYLVAFTRVKGWFARWVIKTADIKK